MAKPISALFFLLFALVLHGQQPDFCEGPLGGSYTFQFPVGECTVMLRAEPGFCPELQSQFKVAGRGEAYRVLVRIAVLDGVPFVYDVYCKGCEGSMHEWQLRKVFQRTTLAIVDANGCHLDGLHRGSLTFTATPRAKP